jgi:hypothetical protein
MAAMDVRVEAWDRLATDLPREMLNKISSVEPMSNISALAEAIVSGKTRGRVVIDVNA